MLFEQCPDLPARDPRQELESFRRSISDSRTFKPPVGVFLTVPDMANSAVGRES
jgi:hypothetical protein